MSVDRERKLNNLFQQHPYLIDDSLEGLKAQSEVWLEDNRLDLLFHHGGRYIIVELKRGFLKPRDVDQLAGYVKKMDERGYALANSHYLVGKRPRNCSLLEKRAKEKEFETVFRFLHYDIHLELVWDNQTDRYVVATEERLADCQRYSAPFTVCL